MQDTKFVHLHLHTDYSILDGACRIEKLLPLCKKYNMRALAITDHGNMFGVIDFYHKMEKEGIKPIIGMETYLAPKNRKVKELVDGVAAFHFTLLAKNMEGYRNLMKLSSIGYIEGFYYNPRIDKEVLNEFSKGLIGLSGCIKGEIPYFIQQGNIKKAEEKVKEYLQIFGEDDFYLEVMRLGLKENDLVNAELIEIGRKLGVPIVATNDCHYLQPEDKEAHDILLCIQTRSEIDEKERLRFESEEVYFKSPEEMGMLFSDHPEFVEMTVTIAEKCHVGLKLDPKKVILPNFPLKEGFSSAEEQLEREAGEGFKNRYPTVTEEILTRFKYEIEVIKKMGYAGYFLIVKDLVEMAKKRKIPVGPGRGSTVGSVVCYCLGITQVDPIKYGLLFERFLNPERVSPPDIDIDVGDERREEVIEYLKTKYGKEAVCQITTFGTMAARAVVRDVGRVLKVSLRVIDRLAKTIPPGTTIEEAMKLEEVKEIIEEHPEVVKVLKIGTKLEGMVRHVSTHAAGIAIVPGELTQFLPLYKSTEEVVSSQYSMKALEKLGVIKFDILGLRTLTVIDNTLKEIGIKEIPLEDKKTFSLLKKGYTVGLFQLESEGMQEILRRASPNSIEDIMAVLALYRPGPLGGFTKDQFLKRKQKQEKITYLHPELKPVLEETYGVILYQEQVMQIASSVAGFSLGEADLLRRAMGKKIPEIMEEKRKEFVDGAKRNNIKEEIANKIFNLIAPFAGYGFNKSHSAGYAFLSYQTAWLKANYPAEFMAATLTSERQNTERIKVLIKECKRMGIEVVKPDVNYSGVNFKVERKGEKCFIRYGLSAIKGLGYSAALECVRRKPFRSFNELLGKTRLNKKVYENLIKAGALDSITPDRKKLLSQLENKGTPQLKLFETKEKKEEKKEEEWEEGKLLYWEKEALGFYFSGHPLEKYREEIETFATVEVGEIKNKKQEEEVIIAGVVSRKRVLKEKNVMFLGVEDFSGTVDVVVFSDKMEKVKNIKVEDEILIKGKVTFRNERSSIRLVEVIPLPRVRKKFIKWVEIDLNIPEMSEELMKRVKKILQTEEGDKELFLKLKDERVRQELVLKSAFKINAKRNTITQLRKIVGEKNVRLGGTPVWG